MLVAHISDLHLGYSQFNLEEREEDIYETFREAIEISIRERVGLVILAGDIFHTPRPCGKAIVTLGNALKQLKEKEIPAAFILGEHDTSRTRDVPLPFLFSNLGLAKHLKPAEPLKVGNCSVFGVDKIRKGNSEELAKRLEEAGNAAAAAEGKKILVLHQGLTDINRFAGELNATDLPSKFDYYAMGHYHDREERRYGFLGGPLIYPGSIDLTPSEGIKDVEKGFVIVDLSGQEASTSWVRLARRKQFAMRIAYDNISAEVDRVISRAEEMAKQVAGKKPVAKIEIAGKGIDTNVVANSLRRLGDACLHYVWQPVEEGAVSGFVYDQRPADIDAELYRLAEQVLGSTELASFAVNELLPALSESESEGLKVVWEAYTKGRLRK